MNPNELESAFEQATAAGDFENAYAIEQQLKGLPQEQRSTLGEIGRQLGLTGRAIAGGAAQIAEPFTEPVRYLMNKVLPGNPIGNIEAATDEVATAVGLPEPQGALEEGVQSVGRFATGFAGGFGGANKIDDAVTGLLGLSKHIKTVPTTAAELRGIADAAYKVADDAGVYIKPDSFKAFVNNLDDVVKNAGIDRTIHPKATAALGRLREAVEEGRTIKLKDLEILRRVARGAGKSIEADERRIGGIIIDALDDYTSGIGAIDVASGDPKFAMSALKTALVAWMRMSKSNVISDAVETAGVNAETYSGAGFENALRIQFKQIARNKKRMRGFTKEEQAAIKKVAMGGKLDNAMRQLGKLAPTGVISGAIGGSAGYAVGGPVGAVALPAAGAVARRVATNRTMRNVDDLSNLVLGNKTTPKDMAEKLTPPDWLLPWISGTAVGADVQE